MKHFNTSPKLNIYFKSFNIVKTISAAMYNGFTASKISVMGLVPWRDVNLAVKASVSPDKIKQ